MVWSGEAIADCGDEGNNYIWGGILTCRLVWIHAFFDMSERIRGYLLEDM